MVLITAPKATMGSLWKGIDVVDVGRIWNYLEGKGRLLQGIGAASSNAPPSNSSGLGTISNETQLPRLEKSINGHVQLLLYSVQEQEYVYVRSTVD